MYLPNETEQDVEEFTESDTKEEKPEPIITKPKPKKKQDESKRRLKTMIVTKKFLPKKNHADQRVNILFYLLFLLIFFTIFLSKIKTT